MSHFSVVVVGENVDEQLAPFDENLEGCKMPKWDWHTVGGRWEGFFPLRSDLTDLGNLKLQTTSRSTKSGRADQCKWGEVDIEVARLEKVTYAERIWRLWGACLEKAGGSTLISWQSFIDKVEAKQMDMEAAREAYHDQPLVKAAQSYEELRWQDLESLGTDRDAYIERIRCSALVPYAVLMNGEWHQRGEMGWFGVSSDEKDKGAWEAEVAKMYDSLDPETMVTLCDCHI